VVDEGAATATLDVRVARLRRELAEASVPAPRVLLAMATGLGGLPDELRHVREVEHARWPEPWPRAAFLSAMLGDVPVWLLEDLAGEPGHGETAAWNRALPVWVAAECGAGLLVHTSAGALLGPGDSAGGRAPGALAVLSDHLAWSDRSPLLGLGPSRLGPLFPDLSTLHHPALRRAALATGEAIGVPVFEAVAACTPGPALETPAEREMLRRLGAGVSVQALAPPLLAAAHAGLSVLALVCIADAGEGPADVGRLLETARRATPRAEELILALADDLGRCSAAE